jgi:uncharacterized iron-regulated membrane protein
MGFIDRPQRLWWRMAIFQIHLWVGIALCLYMLVIGVTGSILVFEKELEHVAYARVLRAPAKPSGDMASFPQVVDTVRRAYSDYQISVAYLPERPGDNYELFIRRGKQTLYVFVDAVTGKIAGSVDPDHSWMVWIIDLHFRLLGGKVGLLLNGIGAACLLLLCVSGVVLWWAGLRHWTRGLNVNFNRSWRRINFDLHSAVGFWTLLILSMWAFTGMYFVWPKQVESIVSHFSSTASANPPLFVVPPRGATNADLEMMIEQAVRASPQAHFAGAFFPGSKGALTLLMARDAGSRSFTRMDYVYFDPSSGRQLAIWRRGVNTTWGSRFLFWLSPLHFGYDWGMLVKIIWATLGCAMPLLSITGVIMYWNRSLGKKWKALRASR